MKTGLIIPVYKKRGKDPFMVSSYRGITLCSTVAKLYEQLLLNHMAPIVDVLNLPDGLQTAYCKGMACSDAIFFYSGGCPLLSARWCPSTPGYV